ncbi:MAG: Asp-tRNA(Asn)/Glu-tRNA(Gln) amidotransferase subunit GatB, partial [Deltaproteobacteria bacterium]|nr:Asp-tRNA(Asn)/Glu-tRNA(Gln) amidotransferase subunit GatB [Deltaproteobacteria bacterium]
GVPLIEIVSGPDLRTPREATQYLKTLRSMLMYLGVCDGNMQEGSLRCDANVSVRPVGSRTFGTRTELKNLNSFRFLERAIAFEIDRQIHVIEAGGAVVQETRLWNDARGISESMRSKEEAHDYRYFPDPDLLPLTVAEADIAAIRAALPELAQQKAARFIAECGLSDYDARLLTGEKPLAEFFETALKAGAATPARAKKLANWILTELLGQLNAEGREITDSRVTPAALSRLVDLIEAGTISGKMAKEIFAELYAHGGDPGAIVKAKGLAQVSDADALAAVIDAIVAEQPANVAAYRAGKAQLLGFFVGEVMKKTKGQANPQLVNELLRKKLSEGS